MRLSVSVTFNVSPKSLAKFDVILNNRQVRYIMFKKFVFCSCPDSRCSSDGEDLIRERQLYL